MDGNIPLLQHRQHRLVSRGDISQHPRLYAQLGKGQPSIRDHSPAFVRVHAALHHAVNRRRANDCHRTHIRLRQVVHCVIHSTHDRDKRFTHLRSLFIFQ